MHNIKGHRETEIALGRLTVLVGPNGAGKTTALQALDAVCRFSRQGLFAFFSGDMSWEMLARRGRDRARAGDLRAVSL